MNDALKLNRKRTRKKRRVLAHQCPQLRQLAANELGKLVTIGPFVFIYYSTVCIAFCRIVLSFKLSLKILIYFFVAN